MRRTIFALVAMFSSTLIAVSAAPADARAAVDTRGDHGAVTAATIPGALPAHDVRRLKAFEIRQTGRFRVTGKAVTYRRKDVILKKSSRKAGPYHYVDKDRTDAEGRFAINFDGRIGTHFKIFLKRTDHNRATAFYIGKIVRD